MSLKEGIYWLSGMSLWQRCVVVILLGAAVFGGGAYFARIVSRPEGLDGYRSIPWVTFVTQT